MTNFLFESEPSTYSYSDLERDKRAVRDRVSNAPARIAALGGAKPR